MPRIKRSRMVMSLVHPNAAAIDIGATLHVAAVGPDHDPEPVRSFGTFTGDLHRLADWFKQCGVSTVAMESTGVYFSPNWREKHLCCFNSLLAISQLSVRLPPRAIRRTDANRAALKGQSASPRRPAIVAGDMNALPPIHLWRKQPGGNPILVPSHGNPGWKPCGIGFPSCTPGIGGIICWLFIVRVVARHRRTKEAATDMLGLQPPRHISTLPISAYPVPAVMSGSTSSGRGPNCENDVMGHIQTHAAQQHRATPFPWNYRRDRLPRSAEDRRCDGGRSSRGLGIGVATRDARTSAGLPAIGLAQPVGGAGRRWV
jgi:hypothetical protein